ncbi:Lcl C-terminal domain-containing protein [Nitrospira sp. M1]
MKIYMVSQSRTRQAVSLGVILLILSIVVGGVGWSSDALVQERTVEIPSTDNTKKYPTRPRINGYELRSFGDSSKIRRAGKGRFALVLAGKAVFDKKGGIVWERSPDPERRNWSSAVSYCSQKVVGGRKGWRIPTFAELSSLMDPNNPNGNPDFPIGHPFKSVKSYLSPRNVELAFYWFAKADADGPGGVWDVFQNDGIAGDTISKENDFLVWCVFGGNTMVPVKESAP